MNFEQIKSNELYKAALAYEYDAALFRPFEEALTTAVLAYGGSNSKKTGTFNGSATMTSHGVKRSFGEEMLGHMARVSEDTRQTMIGFGMNATAAKNIGEAMRWHDCGKPATDPALWQLTDKPTPDQKNQREDHVRLIGKVFLDTLKTFSDDYRAAIIAHPHFAVMMCVGENHHERINGKGPQKISDLDIALEIIGIADTVDGKRKVRDHVSTIYTEMQGQPSPHDGVVRHKDEFSQTTLAKYIDLHSGQRPSSRRNITVANHTHS